MEETSNKVRHKSPTKAARDKSRARQFWDQVRGKRYAVRCSEVSGTETRPEGLNNSKSAPRKTIWKKVTSIFGKKKVAESNAEDASAKSDFGTERKGGRANGCATPEPLSPAPKNIEGSETSGGCALVDPRPMYELTEDRMRMSRLEEEKHLISALRHLVRTLHEGGRQIAFPVPEAVDRIRLKCTNLPTDPDKLLGLVLQVFARREEPFDLDGVYRDFVRSHGRTVYNSKEQWPQCYATIRYP